MRKRRTARRTASGNLLVHRGHYGHGHGANKERAGITGFRFCHCLSQRSQYLQEAKVPSCMEVGYSAIQQQQLTWFPHYLLGKVPQKLAVIVPWSSRTYRGIGPLHAAAAINDHVSRVNEFH